MCCKVINEPCTLNKKDDISFFFSLESSFLNFVKLILTLQLTSIFPHHTNPSHISKISFHAKMKAKIQPIVSRFTLHHLTLHNLYIKTALTI